MILARAASPGLMIFLTVISITVVGDGLRDVLDPYGPSCQVSGDGPVHDRGADSVHPVTPAPLSRHPILVLDNIEQVRSSAAHIAALLAACPGVAIAMRDHLV